ncbi:hypothetical protein ACUR5C_08330 [Aliikangiella sp. IMCC44653]
MTNQFKQNIFNVSQQGLSVCEQLEKGQAETPLAEHFQQIERDIDSSPFSMVLMGLTTEARTAVLAWLYGKDFSVLSVNVVKQLGLVEISLRERGYTLERANGERQEFDRLDPFMEALQKSDVLSPNDGQDWVDPIRLGVNSAKGLQGLKVYMPESPDMVLKNPGLLNRVITKANLLVVAAPLHYELSDNDQKAILEVSENMDGFWPLLIIDELEEDTGLPEIGWWQKHNAPTVQLKPQLLTTHVDARIPSMLQDIDDKARQALFLHLQARRVIHASEAVAERSQQELRLLQGRQKREQRKSQAAETEIKSGGIERHQWDDVRSNITDKMAKLNKKFQEQGKKSLLPEAELSSQLKQFVDRLSVSDLNQEPGHASIKLSVKDSFLDELKNQLKVLLKRQLKSELSDLNKDLAKQRQLIEKQAKELTAQPQIIEINSPDEHALWSGLKEQLSVSVRYRGEMPKRGFMARLSDGRKAIMGISMMAMVIGGLFKAVWGVDFRSMIMLIAPLIFIGAIVYSYIVWPKEDAERFAKELDRVKEGLTSEIKRLLSELQRDKQAKVSDHLDGEKKAILKKLDELNRNTQASQEQAVSQQKQQAARRLTQIDQQIKELQMIDLEISSLKRQCDNLEREGTQQLKRVSV